jgi:hypothetical protein
VSIEASSFVLGLSMGRGNGIRKLILLGYANHADKHGRGAYPSTRTIADYAECDVPHRAETRRLVDLQRIPARGRPADGRSPRPGTGPSSTTWR